MVQQLLCCKKMALYMKVSTAANEQYIVYLGLILLCITEVLSLKIMFIFNLDSQLVLLKKTVKYTE